MSETREQKKMRVLRQMKDDMEYGEVACLFGLEYAKEWDKRRRELPVEFIPLYRDKKAVAMYKFCRWFMRRNRAALEKEIRKALHDYVIYGKKPEGME